MLEKFSKEQLDIINLGITDGIDVSIYCNIEYSPWKMLRIYEAIKGGFEDIRHYVDDYDAGQLTQIYRVYKNGYPFGLILDRGYSFIEMYLRINSFEARLNQ